MNDARQAIDRAHRLAPDDLDILLLQGRIALWSGRHSQARAIANDIGRRDPANRELAEFRQSLDRAEAAKAPAFSASHGLFGVRMKSGRRTWTETLIAMDGSVTRDIRVTAQVQRVDRNVAADTEVGLRLDRPGGSAGGFYVAASTTPKADFRPRWSLGAGGERRIARALVLTLDTRHSDYRSSRVTAVEPGIRIEGDGGRWSLSVRSINLWQSGRGLDSGGAMRIDARASRGTSLFAGAATYPDTDGGITRRMRSVYGGAAVDLSRRLSVRGVIAHDDRRASYRSVGGSLSLRWRLM